MDTDKIPSSINPSETFLDIANFFSQIEAEDNDQQNENKKPDVYGFALFQDRKQTRKHQHFTASVKVMDCSRRSKDIANLAEALAYEMVHDFRIMSIVTMAVNGLLYKHACKNLTDMIDNKDKDKDDKK